METQGPEARVASRSLPGPQSLCLGSPGLLEGWGMGVREPLHPALLGWGT